MLKTSNRKSSTKTETSYFLLKNPSSVLFLYIKNGIFRYIRSKYIIIQIKIEIKNEEVGEMLTNLGDRPTVALILLFYLIFFHRLVV